MSDEPVETPETPETPEIEETQETDAEPHGDFELDDLVTDLEDAGPEDIEEVILISDEDAVNFRVNYEPA